MRNIRSLSALQGGAAALTGQATGTESRNGHHTLTLREAAIFAVQLREQGGGAGRDSFFVEALDIEDAARRGKAIAVWQSAPERGAGIFWEVERIESAGTVRRLFPELKAKS